MSKQSLLYPEQIERLLDLYADHPQAEALVNRLFPYLEFDLASLEQFPLAISRVGGWPDLPADFPWPLTRKGLPYSFLLQLNCANLCPDPLSTLLPLAGMLYLFQDDGNGCQVLYVPDAQATSLLPSVAPSLQFLEREQNMLPCYPPHAIVNPVPNFLFRDPYALTMRDLDRSDFEYISACLFPRYARMMEEALLSRSTRVEPSPAFSAGSGQLLNLINPGEYFDTAPGDDRDWLILLKLRAWHIFACDATRIFIPQHDCLNKTFAHACIIDTN